MSKYPQSLERLIHELKKLPGIGRVSAERLAFYLLSQSDERITNLSQALVEVKEKIQLCEICFNYSEQEQCLICRDAGRDRSMLCVVSQPH
jgi:recombination protein RecR